MLDVYDEVAYPGSAFPDTHPDRLATIAHLLGLSPAAPDTCRVLELGCGDGANLISLACALPGATLFGIDRAAGAIGRGLAAIEELGLGNVRLDVADLLHVSAHMGEFDVVIAHGLYSWVPEPVRRKALAIAAASLAPDGIAFFSYLAQPGNHARDVYREVMRYHVRGIADPAERVRQARAIVRLLADTPAGPREHRALAASVADELERADDGVVYHDFLAAVNDAFLFADFMRDAHAEGLQFLSEAEYPAGFLRPDGAPAAVMEALRRLDADVLTREQYHDFLRRRGFRQTLLCRRDAPVHRPADPGRLKSLHVAARIATHDGMVDLREGVPVHFATHGGELTVHDAPAKAALAVLGSAWPATMRFDALLARIRDVSPVTPDGDAVARFLLGCYERGAIELWTSPPRCAASAGPLPEASPLARRQHAQGLRRVSSLRNETIELRDDLAHATLGLLDGTRGRAEIVAALAAALREGGGAMELEGREITEEEEIRAVLTERLEDALGEFAENGLLVA